MPQANSSFVQKQGKGKEAYLAYGQTIQTTSRVPLWRNALLDFTPLQDNENIATFLYAMPLSHDTLFVENGSLPGNKFHLIS